MVDQRHDRLVIGDMLSQRCVEHGLRRPAGVPILGVAHNAYDFKRGVVLRHIQAEVFSDGILVGEKPLGEGFADHGDVARAACVLFGDTTAAHNRLAHRFQITGADAIPRRSGIVIQLWHPVTFGNNQFAPVVNVRGIEGERCALLLRGWQQGGPATHGRAHRVEARCSWPAVRSSQC